MMTPEILMSLLGAAMSLIFSYVPWLNEKFASLPADVKRLIMAGLLLVTAAVVYLGQCWLHLWAYDITCDRAGILHLLYIYLLALIANQSTYAITVLPAPVKTAKSR